MIHLRHITLTLFLLGLGTASVRAQVNVVASVNENKIGDQETVRYRVEVQGGTYSNTQTPQPPRTEGLTLVQSSPSTEQNISYVNGNLRQSLSFIWNFRPTGIGTARIGSTSVSVEGKNYRTDPISLTIVPQSERPVRPKRNTRRTFPSLLDDPSDTPVEPSKITEQDVFIRARPSTRSVFKNQQFTVTYDLFFREGVQLRSNRLADSWDAEGFWREDLEVEQRATMRQEIVNGLRYNVVTLKRVVAFPTRTGDLVIEPLRMESEVALPRRGSFNSLILRNYAQFQSATISSRPISIKARALPPNAPPRFSDAVGSFRLDARADRTEIEVGEPVILKVSVSGRGNIATLDEPALELPTMIDRYDLQISDKINRKQTIISGTKSFNYTLVPRSSGIHTIPPIELSYFNPSNQQYTSLRSEPIIINVTGTASPATATIAETDFPANDIAGLITSVPQWKTRNLIPLHRNIWPYLVVILPWMLLLGLFLYRRHALRLQNDAHFARNRRAHPLARKHLKLAEKRLAQDQPIPFYEAISQALIGFIGDRLNMPAHGMHRKQLDRLLAQNDVPVPTRKALYTLLDECDQARFSPIRPSHDIMETATDRAAALITDLNVDLTTMSAS